MVLELLHLDEIVNLAEEVILDIRVVMVGAS